MNFSEDKVIFINFSILLHKYTINTQLLKKNKLLTSEIRLLQEDIVNIIIANSKINLKNGIYNVIFFSSFSIYEVDQCGY